MRLIFLLRARVTRANGCFELEHPRCQGLRDSHMRDDVRRDVVVRTDANENSDTLRDFRYLSVFDRAQRRIGRLILLSISRTKDTEFPFRIRTCFESACVSASDATLGLQTNFESCRL